MQVAELLPVEVERVEQLAVDVELGLAPGAVAHAHGPALAPAAQVRQLALGQVVLAADPVHDLQRAVLPRHPAGRAGHERDEVDRLVWAGTGVQRLEREAAVADPREPVVPVALTPDRLGQARRGRRHDRAGRPVGQALEHAGAEAHELAVRAVVDVVLGLPREPGLGDLLDSRAHIPGRRGLGLLTFDRRPAHGEPRLLPGSDREPGLHRRPVDLRLDACGHGHPVRAAERPPSVFGATEQRPDQSVLRPRSELHHDLHPALDPLDQPQQLVRRADAQVVRALPLYEGHGVEQADRALPGGEGRLDDQRAREVAPRDLERRDGTDRPVAGVAIEQPGEHGRAVVARQAQPVDRAVLRRERGRVAIGEQAVVGDRGRVVGHRP